MTTSMTAQPTIAPVECQPWCVWQDGEGAYCGSESPEVPLTRDVEDVDEENRRVVVAAAHEPNEGTWIEIFRPDQRGYQFTPEQARQLVENLQLVLGQIEGAAR